MYRIAVVDARNIARLTHVHLELDAEQHLYLIAGKNAQGKTSLLDAIESTLAGKRSLPEVPVRVGEARGYTQIDLVGDDGVTYKVTRVVDPSGDTKLEIRGPEGLVRKPQEWLDRITGDRFFDPMFFLGSKNDARRKILLQVAGVDTDAVDQERKRVYDKRTEAGRDLEQAQGQYASLPNIPPQPEAARPISEIVAESRGVGERATRNGTLIAEGQMARASADAAERRRADSFAALEKAQRAVEAAMAHFTHTEAEALVARTHADVATAAAVEAESERQALTVRNAELRIEMDRAETVSRWQATAAVMRTQHDAAKKRVEDGTALREAFTAELAEIDDRKARMLAEAKMPVPGLTVTDDGVLLDGLPFEAASQAQRIRAALVISMVLSKELRVLLVRDGSHLDEDMIADLRTAAEDLDCCVWVEVVGERHEGAIIMRAGAVVAPSTP